MPKENSSKSKSKERKPVKDAQPTCPKIPLKSYISHSNYRSIRGCELLSIDGVFVYILREDGKMGALTAYRKLSLVSLESYKLLTVLCLDRLVIPLSENLQQIHAWGGDRFILHWTNACDSSENCYIICRLPNGMNEHQHCTFWNHLQTYTCLYGDVSFKEYSKYKPRSPFEELDQSGEDSLRRKSFFKPRINCINSYEQVERSLKTGLRNVKPEFWEEVFVNREYKCDEENQFVKDHESIVPRSKFNKIPCESTITDMHIFYANRPLDVYSMKMDMNQRSVHISDLFLNLVESTYELMVEKMNKRYQEPFESKDFKELIAGRCYNARTVLEKNEEKLAKQADIFDQILSKHEFYLIDFDVDIEKCKNACAKRCDSIHYTMSTRYSRKIQYFVTITGNLPNACY